MLRIVSGILLMAIIAAGLACEGDKVIRMPSPTQDATQQTPPIQVSLDYFGIKNTHQPSIYIAPNTIQLYVIADDGKKRKEFSYPYSGQGIPMEPFHLEDLRQQTIFQTPSIGDYLRLSVLAYSCADKEATLSLGRALEAFEPSMGPLLDFFERLPQSKQLIGWYEHTWYANNEWGAEQGRYEGEGQGDLRLWFRIWSDAQTKAFPEPSFVPDVRIQDVRLPENARVRTFLLYRESSFSFTLVNNESFGVPVYWRLETAPYSPETTINFIIYPTQGRVIVPSNDAVTVTAKYWFTTPSDYRWTYIIESPRGNDVTSWTDTLTVNP